MVRTRSPVRSVGVCMKMVRPRPRALGEVRVSGVEEVEAARSSQASRVPRGEAAVALEGVQAHLAAQVPREAPRLGCSRSPPTSSSRK